MKKILIINRLGIGDVVLTTPLAKLLKEHADVRIGFVVAEKAADILKNHPYIDDVFAYHKKKKPEILAEIRQRGYEEAILVDERFSSTLFAWKAGCHLLNKGFEISLGKKRLLKRKSRARHAMEDFASYGELVGISAEGQALRAVIGRPDADRSAFVEDWLEKIQAQTKELVLIVPRAAGDIKNWNPAELGKLNVYLNEQGTLPVYIGSKYDADYIEAIPGKKINAAGVFSLRELPLLGEKAKFALSMCTGPLHILGTVENLPLLAIYGPSDPKRWAPKQAMVIQSKLDCVPCQLWTGCPKEQGQRCMDEIKFDQIKEVILELL